MIFSFHNKVLAISILLLIVVGCRKKGCTDPIASNYNIEANYDNGLCEYDTGNVYEIIVKTYHTYNSNPLYLDSVYYDDFGNKIKFSRAVFYAGNPIFTDINGTTNQITSDYLLIKPTDTIYPFVSLTNIDLSLMNLTIGVDSITNHTDQGSKEIKKRFFIIDFVHTFADWVGITANKIETSKSILSEDFKVQSNYTMKSDYTFSEI